MSTRACSPAAPANAVKLSAVSRRLLFATASVAAVIVGAQQAGARSLGGGSSLSTPAAAAAAAAQNGAQDIARAARRSQEALQRSISDMRSMDALQAAARAAAAARASGIPHGLQAGGLQVAPGATPGSTLWQGSKLPTEFTENGRSKVTIEQTEQKSILTWQSFNVSEKTDLHFDQRAGGADVKNWISFNRVLDTTTAPSRVLGTIKAEGQVYVINRNGIVFGAGSQVNVGTLVASSLALSNEQFLRGINNPIKQDGGAGNDFGVPQFGDHASGGGYGDLFVPGAAPGGVSVEAGASIKAVNGGKVMLFAPKITNAGHLAVDDGQVILAAGEQVWLTGDLNGVRGLDVAVSAPGARLFTYGDVMGALGLWTNYGGFTNFVRDTILPGMEARAAEVGYGVTNFGLIHAERGNVTLQSREVFQNGVVTASSALNNREGSIRLRAWGQGFIAYSSSLDASQIASWSSGTLTLGANSVTAVLPDLTDTSEIEQALLATRYKPGNVQLRGNLINVESLASVMAPSGIIDVVAAKVPISQPIQPSNGPGNQLTANDPTEKDGSRIYIDRDAYLTVAGLKDILVPMARNFIQAELYINELRDSPLYRDSWLRGLKVIVDRRVSGTFDSGPMSGVEWISGKPGQWVGSPLADFSKWIGVGKTDLAELSTVGGSIILKSGGSVITRAGSLLDVSGGSVRYSDGINNTTKLLGFDGRVYNIGDATSDMVYIGLPGRFARAHLVQGLVDARVNEIWTTVFDRGGPSIERGYTEGRNAGSIQIYAGEAMILDGSYWGGVVTGEQQALNGKNAKAGSLKIGAGSDPDRGWSPSVLVISEEARLLPADFNARSIIPDGYYIAPDLASQTSEQKSVWLDTSVLNESGLGKIDLFVTKSFTLEKGAVLSLDPGATFSVTSNASVTRALTFDIDGSIRIPSGTVSFGSAGTGLRTINLGADARIDVSGQWINSIIDGESSRAPAIDGGSISLTSATINVARGAVLDVSGGGWVGRQASKQSLKVGDAGTITLPAIAGDQMANLDMRAFAAGSGGTLVLESSSRVQLGGVAPSDPSVLYVPGSLYAERGFRSVTITARGDIVVPEDTVISYIPFGVDLSGVNVGDVASGARIYDVGAVRTLPERERATRDPVHIGLTTIDADVIVGAGAVVRTDVGGSVGISSGRDALLRGTIDAAAGEISITAAGKLHLAASGQLIARGAALIHADSRGFRSGEVKPGGTISLDSGNLALDAGGLIDVSGASGEIDLRRGGFAMARGGTSRQLASDGGVISIRGNGVIASALVGRPGGIGAVGGRLSVDHVEAPGGGGMTPGEELLSYLAGWDPTCFFDPYTCEGKAQNAIGFDLGLIFEGWGMGPMPTMIITQELIDLLSARGRSELVVSENAGGGRPGGALDPSRFGLTPEALDAFRDNIFFSELLRTSLAAPPSDSVLVLRPSAINGGGLADIRLSSSDAVKLDGATVSAGRLIAIEGPISNFSTLSSSFRAPTIQLSLGAATAALGDAAAELALQANLIEILDTVSIRGFAQTRFEAIDLRLSATPPLQGQPAARALLDVEGDIQLKAAQIYPATGVRATIKTAGTITVLSNGEAAAPLSAGGSLTLEAKVIQQNGVLRAPFGQITLKASERVMLGSGSVTSVSGAGLVVPYGSLSNGEHWIDPSVAPNQSDPASNYLAMPPEKRVTIDAPSIDVGTGSTIDLRGGGDLYAREFVPGPGGSHDILNTPNSYAILPGYNGVSPGDVSGAGGMVHLAGGNGLAAGWYTLLPSSYAALPGAYLITMAGTIGSAVAPAAIGLFDGSTLMSGLRANAISGGYDQLTTSWRVMSGAQLRQYSEYNEALANTYFASDAFKLTRYRLTGQEIVTPRLPIDGGAVVFKATQELVLNGQLRSQAANGGRGGLVDIAGAKIAIVGTGQDVSDLRTNGYLVVDANQLTNFGASSLLIGGTRTGDARGLRLDVAATDVIVRNDGNSALAGPEILLAASGLVDVRAGSVIMTRGELGAGSGDLILTPQVKAVYVDPQGWDDGDPSDDVLVTPSRDYGALIRLSNAAPVNVIRENVDIATGGVVKIGDGAWLSGGNSLLIDATGNTELTGTASLSAVALSLSSGRIGFGGGSQGLVLSDASFAQLANTQNLTLRSYTTIDFHKSISFGGVGLATVTLDAAGYVGVGNHDVTVTGRRIALQNSGQPATGAGQAGTGTLTLSADELILGAGTKRFDGFGQVTLAAGSQVVGEGTGRVDTGSAALTVSTPVLTGRKGAVQSLVTTGTLSVVGDTTAPLADMQGSLGARLSFSGSSVYLGSRIVALGGAVDVTSTGGDIVLASGSLVDVGGFAKPMFDVTSYSDAGRIAFTAVGGNIVMQTGAAMNLAAHVGGGNAGNLSIVASGGGNVALDGTIAAHGGAGGRGGAFTLDIAALPDFAGLSDRLNAAGFNASRQFRVRNGDVIIDGQSQVNDFSVTADMGRVTVAGLIDARATYGGRIAVSGGNGVVMTASAQLLAGATDGELGSGRVTLDAAGGQLDLRGGLINVAGGEGGRVRLRARQTASDLVTDGHEEIAVLRLDAAIIGARSAVLEGVSVYDGVTSVGAAERAAAVGDAQTFASHMPAIAARLGNGDVTAMPGIEFRSSGDLTLESDWNLFTDFASLREGGLTLRAAGDLIVKGHLSDGFDLADRAGVLQDARSWDLRLVAGADLSSANILALTPLAVLPAAKGNLVVGDAAAGKQIRTGTGDIDVRVGRNLDLAKNQSVIYTAGRADTTVWPDFTSMPAGAVFGVEGGHLDISAQGNITSAVAPSVPGSPSNSDEYQVFAEWLYRQGYIDIDVVFTAGAQTAWWVNYATFQQGVGALGGGNVSVNAGGDLVNLLVAQPTNARVRGGRTPSEAKTLEMRGGGAMTVTAAGTIAGGQYYVARGAGVITAGELGIGRTVGVTQQGGTLVTQHSVAPVLALGDATLAVRTSGTLRVQTVLDPLMIAQARAGDPASAARDVAYISGHTGRTAIDLVSIGGDVVLVNDARAIYGDMNWNGWSSQLPDLLRSEATQGGSNRYSARTRVTALNGSIEIGGPLYTMPDTNSDLRLLADQDVRLVNINPLNVEFYSTGAIIMSRATPEMMPSPLRPYRNVPLDQLIANTQSMAERFNTDHYVYIESVRNPDRLPMADDLQPSRIYARNGSIIQERNTKITTNEQTWMRSGMDVRGANYALRNIRTTDTSLIEAGNDILASVGTYAGKVEIEGPGSLLMTAGRDIFSGGIPDGFGGFASLSVVSVGNRGQDANNRPVPLTAIKGLAEEGANITLMAGLNGRQPAYAAFMTAYLDPANLAAMPDHLKTTLPDGTVVPLYLVDRTETIETGATKLARRGLVSFIEEITGEKLSPLAAWERFRALPQLTQQAFLHRVYMQELREAGRDQLSPDENGIPVNGGYNRGYAAIAALFPGDAWKGDIVSTNLTVQTMAGGDINVLTPGGGLQLAALGASVPAGAGIVTLDSGHINIFSKDDVTVNRSRILTFVPETTERGSDVIIWSTLGGIDAGRGAKTLRVPSAPDILTDKDAVTRILERPDMSGSGIGTVGGDDGDLDMVAPRGTVNFGDAGVRASRRLTVTAYQVLNFSNADFKESKGLPPVPKSVPAVSKPENDNKTANEAAKSASQAGPSQTPSVIIVEVLGYGGGDAVGTGESDAERSREDERRRKRSQSYDPNAPVQVVGHGALSVDQMAVLTPEEQARKRAIQ